MSRRTKNSQGSITVYLTLILVFVLALVAAFLEVARVHIGKNQVERCLTGSADAVLTRFYEPLYEDYHVLFMDKGLAGVAAEKKKIKKEIKGYMKEGFGTTTSRNIAGYTLDEQGMDLLQLQIKKIKIKKLVRATDEKGKIFRDEVLQYEKFAELAEGVKKLGEKLETMENEETVSGLAQKELEVGESYQQANQYIISLLQSVEGIVCNESGMVYKENGLIKTQGSFAKKICTTDITKANVGIDNDTVWNSLNTSYINPMSSLKQIRKKLNTLIKKAEEEALQAENPETEEEENELVDEDENQEDTEGENEVEETAVDYTAKIAEIHALQDGLKVTVTNVKSQVASSLNTIRLLESEKEKIETEVEAYGEEILARQEQLSEAQYQQEIESKSQLQDNLVLVDQVLAWKPVLEKNLIKLTNLENTLTKRVNCSLESFQKQKKRIKKRIAGMKKYEICQLKFNYSNVDAEKNEQNPIQILKQLTQSTLELVIEDTSTISGKSMEQEDYYYKKYGSGAEEETANARGMASNMNLSKFFGSIKNTFGTERGLTKIKNNIIEHILYQSYIQKHFRCYTTEEDIFSETPLKYEQEYILCGKETDKENLKSTINRILLLRSVSNFTYVLTDTNKREKAYVAAVALVGFTGIDPVVRLTQMGILVAWSYEESLVDVAALLQGHKVPLIKNQDTFMLKYADILTISKETIQEKAEQLGRKNIRVGVDYQEYLHFLLLFQKIEKKTYRTMDLVEVNMKLRHSELFSMEDCIYAIKVKCKYTIPAKFIVLDFMKSWNLEEDTWKYSTSKQYSY